MYYVTGVVCQIKLGHVVEETDSGKTTAHSNTNHTTSTAVSTTSKQPHEEEGENYIQHTSLPTHILSIGKTWNACVFVIDSPWAEVS